MKKIAEYYPVNNQEDEDGYTLYSQNEIIYENIEREQQRTAPDNISNKQPVSLKHRSRNLYIASCRTQE
jgi:hypothetical protein